MESSLMGSVIPLPKLKPDREENEPSSRLSLSLLVWNQPRQMQNPTLLALTGSVTGFSTTYLGEY